MISLIVGAAFTTVGGYVAGNVARHAFYKHALGAGAVSFVAGFLLSGTEEGPYSGLLSSLGYTLHFPLALLGGWFAARRAAFAPDKSYRAAR